jgi:hypothetical protein
MSRTINNTAYAVQTDVVSTESGLAIEEGTLHTIGGKLKVHLGGQIKEIVIIPAAPAEGTFYLKSVDGEIEWEEFVNEG